MKAELRHFESGWSGLALGIEEAELELLISSLRKIRDSGGHFHFRSEFTGDPGVGDIEVYMLGKNETGGLKIEP